MKMFKLLICIFYFWLNFNSFSGYLLVYERTDITSFNKDFIKSINYSLKQIAPTQFEMNSEFVIRKPINMDIYKGSGQLYIMFNGVYHRQPMKLTKRFCHEYKLATYSNWTIMAQHGNVTGCGILKPGYYYIHDYKPTVKLPAIPVRAGQYKVNIVFTVGKAYIYTVDIYAKIET